MSSSDFEKVCVQDDVLNTTDKVRYAVFKGAQNITPAQYNAISTSNSSITWNIQLPSESTVFSRRIMIKATISVRITGTFAATAPAGSVLVNYGFTSALGPFPLQSLCNTIQATINNNTVSQNQRDVMFQLLRFHDRRELAKYNNSTPNMYDSYLNYDEALGTNNNPLAGWNNVSNDQDFQPRGAFVLDSITGNEPKGSIASDDRNVVLTFTTYEPLMLSPFIWCDPKSNNQGMYGVQTLNFVFNLGLPNRIVRLANSALFDGGLNGATISLPNNAISGAQLYMEFFTRQPSDLVSSRNVVPFAEYPRYITPMLDLAPYDPLAVPLVIPSKTVNFQSIQLNSVPDKLIICCRKVQATQTAFDSDSFLPIEKISINFNNKAGLLSSATQYDLWRMSVESGSNQTWAEFSGFANVGSNVPVANAGASGIKRLSTCGSVLCLEMGRHVELDDVYAPGSIGAFQLQFQTTFQNNTPNAIAANAYEIVLITMNSGVFTIERGTSQTYTAILSRADVLSVSSQPSYSKSSVARLVGGSWEDSFKSLCDSIAPYAGKAEKVKDLIGLGASGGGMSGGGVSGGGLSGGRMKKHLAM